MKNNFQPGHLDFLFKIAAIVKEHQAKFQKQLDEQKAEIEQYAILKRQCPKCTKNIEQVKEQDSLQRPVYFWMCTSCDFTKEVSEKDFQLVV